MQVGKTRKRTIRLYRLTDDSRRLLAGTIAGVVAQEAKVKLQANETPSHDGGTL
jgi:hypothetical protein